MNLFKRQIVVIIAFIAFAAALPPVCRAGQYLVAIGGGERPQEALKAFILRSGGERAKILVITWASGAPDESFSSIKRDLTAVGAATVVQSPQAPLDAGSRAQLIAMLSDATGIFFSGGDQNRIMDVLADQELLALIRKKYASGTPVAGTSAGAAVLSDPMMTGEADLKLLDGNRVGIRPGLGLVPGVIIDQHFLVRQRHNRLFGLLIRFPGTIGIGIDEDTAVAIEDNRRLQVFGKTFVMIATPKGKSHRFSVSFISSGEVFDLKKLR